MCGIVGYIGKATAAPILLDGLRRLEYRGYDSAGLTTIDGGHLETRKCAGRIQALADLLKENAAAGQRRHQPHPLGHPRPAHRRERPPALRPVRPPGARPQRRHRKLPGPPRAASSRPGTSSARRRTPKSWPISSASFTTRRAARIPRRVCSRRRAPALKQVIGTYGIALLHLDVPDVLIGARRGSPLAVGLGKGENFLASDPQAIIAHTQEAIYLKDYDVAVLERDCFEISTLEGGIAGSYEVTKVDFTSDDVKLGDYPHYMLKEIFEQPHAVRDALRGRLSHGGRQRAPGRPEHDPAGTARDRPRHHHRLRHGVPRRVGRRIPHRVARAPALRGGVRQRVPLPQHADGQGHAGPCRQPERRDHRHAGGRAREPAQGPPHAGHLQQRGQHDRARMRRGRLHARRTGDRRGGDEIVHLATGGVHPARAAARAHPAPVQQRRAARSSRNSRRSPTQIERVLEQSDHIREIAAKYAGAKGMLFMGRQYNYPDRARRRAQDEGDHLHPVARAIRARNSSMGSSRWSSRTCRAFSSRPTTRCSTATSTASSRSRRGAAR